MTLALRVTSVKVEEVQYVMRLQPMLPFIFRRRLPRRLPTRIQWLTTSTRKTCPSCSSPLPTALPACPSCNYIAPLPPQVSHHELFQLPTSPNPFKIDTANLKRRFLEAQRVCHPDAWSGKGSVSRGIPRKKGSRSLTLSPERTGTGSCTIISAQQGLPDHAISSKTSAVHLGSERRRGIRDRQVGRPRIRHRGHDRTRRARRGRDCRWRAEITRLE